MTPMTRTALVGELRSAWLIAAIALSALTALVLAPRHAAGAWNAFGNQAATAALNQVNAQAISDNAGGMIVAVSYTHLTLPTNSRV